MCVSDVFQHVIHSPFRRIALSIVTPSSSSRGGSKWRSVSKSTAKRFITLCIGAFLIVRIVMSIGYMQDLEGRSTFFGWDGWLDWWLVHRWKCHFPLMLWIVCIVTSITNYKTANLSWSQLDLL